MTNDQIRTDGRAMRLRDAPKAMWIGLIVGLVAFVVNLSFSSTSSANGVMTSCTYFDMAALIAAAVCVGCAIVSIAQRLRHPGRYPIAAWVVHLFSAVLVLLGVIHLLRAFGIVGGPC